MCYEDSHCLHSTINEQCKLSGNMTDTNEDPLWQVTLRGLEVFNPATMEVEPHAGDDVPRWMPDTDYDGQCFRAGQIFFPPHQGPG